MSVSEYLIAFLVLVLYYLLGKFIAIKVSPLQYRKILVKYYRLAFVLSSFLIIITHLLYVFEGDIFGLPIPGSFGSDSLIYIEAGKHIADKGYSNNIILLYNLGGAASYVFLVAVNFILFGFNPLIVVFFNAFLYSLTLVLFGTFVSYYFNYKLLNCNISAFSNKSIVFSKHINCLASLPQLLVIGEPHV